MALVAAPPAAMVQKGPRLRGLSIDASLATSADQVLGLGTSLPVRASASPTKASSPEKTMELRETCSDSVAKLPWVGRLETIRENSFRNSRFGTPPGSSHSPGTPMRLRRTHTSRKGYRRKSSNLSGQQGPAMAQSKKVGGQAMKRIPSSNSGEHGLKRASSTNSEKRGMRRLRSVAKTKGLQVRVPSNKVTVDELKAAAAPQRTPSRNRVPGLGTALPTPGARLRLRRRSTIRRMTSANRGPVLKIDIPPRAVKLARSPSALGTPVSARSTPISPRYTPVTPWRKWVLYRHEDDPEEKENNIEIGLGALKAQIPLAVPGTKPITIIRAPSMPRSPSSAFQFSFAVQCSFPLCFRFAENQEALIPVALGFSLSLSLLDLLAGVGQGVAQTGFSVNIGQAEAEIPLSLPLLHLPHFLSLATLFPHVPRLLA